MRGRIGCALTVLQSPVRSRFWVRILRSLPAGGVGGGDLILGRAFGRAIDRVTGVPAGASGSPVWVSGKLIGAISAVIGDDNRLVGITPLQAMLALKREPETGMSAPDAKELELSQHHPMIVACSGFSATRVVAEIESRYATRVYGAAPAASRSPQKTKLQPGGPIGAALLSGDLQFGFIGTITLVREPYVFAFGHPLLYAGSTQYPMTTADILDTARGFFPTKVGVLGDTVGTIVQDRGAGTLGRLSQVPQGLVALTLTVTDTDRQSQITVRAQAVPIPGELPFLVYIAALETITRAMNRVGQGLGRWQWVVNVADMLEPIILSEEQYDTASIAFVMAYSVVGMIAEPLSMGLGITSVQLEATVALAVPSSVAAAAP